MEGFWNGTGCYPTCPDGYFGNLQNNNCDKCDPTCLTCLYSSTDCTSCTGTLILY
jgi:proprotein convertase subtilisin/kexin type 5